MARGTRGGGFLQLLAQLSNTIQKDRIKRMEVPRGRWRRSGVEDAEELPQAGGEGELAASAADTRDPEGTSSSWRRSRSQYQEDEASTIESRHRVRPVGPFWQHATKLAPEGWSDGLRTEVMLACWLQCDRTGDLPGIPAYLRGRSVEPLHRWKVGRLKGGLRKPGLVEIVPRLRDHLQRPGAIDLH